MSLPTTREIPSQGMTDVTIPPGHLHPERARQGGPRGNTTRVAPRRHSLRERHRLGITLHTLTPKKRLASNHGAARDMHWGGWSVAESPP
jgi:hypothetical protein